MKTSARKQGYLRSITRRDGQQVWRIERASFDYPWREEWLEAWCRCRYFDGLVWEEEERVLGFALYIRFPTQLYLARLAVHPLMRRQGIGTMLVDACKDQLLPPRRVSLETHVRESNLGGCLFLKRCGFRAREVLRGFYRRDSGEDAYLMRYVWPGGQRRRLRRGAAGGPSRGVERR